MQTAVRTYVCSMTILASTPYVSFPTVLGLITESPVHTATPLGVNATFRCTAVGTVFWEIGGIQFVSQSLVDSQSKFGRFISLPTPSHSEAILTGSVLNNQTTVECFVVEEEGSIRLLNRSEVVSLWVYGEYDHASN